MNLFAHQTKGIDFLREREGAGLFWEMGVGKTRTALQAARKFFDSRSKQKIDRVLVLCPASVKFAWLEELHKLSSESSSFNSIIIAYKEMKFFAVEVLGTLNGNPNSHMPIAIISYSLLQQERHAKKIAEWSSNGRTILIADESSYLKNRTAKQTKGTKAVAAACAMRWLLSGTPVTNSPLDLWAQAEVMYPSERGRGPLHGFSSWYSFRATFAELQLQRLGQHSFSEVVGYKNIDKLQKRFAPFVSRVEKKDCLDLPAKVYTVREVALSKETWKLYCELKKNCLLRMSNGEQRPEPNAAVRILRLSQLTSGHTSSSDLIGNDPRPEYNNFPVSSLDETSYQPRRNPQSYTDISSEKIDWLTESLIEGELKGKAVIVWCRWRRERERLKINLLSHLGVPREIFGGQTANQRSESIETFQSGAARILLAQPHAGGFGLNLTVAHTAVYLSNDYSWAVRAQSEDRIHRTGQDSKCLYVDILATGPDGQRSIDHVIMEALKEKKDLASFTCEAWRKALDD